MKIIDYSDSGGAGSGTGLLHNLVRNIWVDAEIAVTGDGTFGNPYKTIQEALNQIQDTTGKPSAADAISGAWTPVDLGNYTSENPAQIWNIWVVSGRYDEDIWIGPGRNINMIAMGTVVLGAGDLSDFQSTIARHVIWNTSGTYQRTDNTRPHLRFTSFTPGEVSSTQPAANTGWLISGDMWIIQRASPTPSDHNTSLYIENSKIVGNLDSSKKDILPLNLYMKRFMVNDINIPTLGAVQLLDSGEVDGNIIGDYYGMIRNVEISKDMSFQNYFAALEPGGIFNCYFKKTGAQFIRRETAGSAGVPADLVLDSASLYWFNLKGGLLVEEDTGGGGRGVPSKVVLDRIDEGNAAGQMMFWNGTKWTHSETSEIFWDDTQKQLGIGTNSPSEYIHVSANSNDNRAIRIENLNTGNAAVARLIVQNDVGSSYFTGYGSGFTENGAKIPNSSALIASGNRENGLSLVAKAGTGKLRFYVGGDQNTELRAIILPNGNIGFNTVDQFGDGVKVIGIANAGTVPTTNPTGGGIIYAEGGLLKYRDPSGNVYLLSHDLTEKKWEDLKIPLSSTILGGSKQPGFSIFKDNGSGSQGIFLYWFDKLLEEELYFAVQLPHSYAEGTDIKPHIHWVPKTAGGAGLFVRWGLEYEWKNVNDVYGNTTIIYSDASAAVTATTSGDASLSADKHYKTSLGTISGAGKTISSMIVGRVFRDATHTDDDYDDDAGLLEIDFHYQNDSRGSTAEFTK